MSDIEDSNSALKDAVKKLRSGGFVAGMDLVKEGTFEYLVTGRAVYKVQGQDRLRLVLVESPEEETCIRKSLENSGAYVPDNEAQHLETAPNEPQTAADTTSAPEAQRKARPVKGKAQAKASEEVICKQCGTTFTRSKFNPYFETCNACRKKDRRTGGQDRRFTCVKCGNEFWISKYQPYLNPDACPHCHRNANIRRRQKRIAAEAKAAKQATGI